MKNLIEWKRAIFQSKMKVAVPIMTHPGVDSCGYSVKKLLQMEPLMQRLFVQ